jgi:hypothetical protein
MKPKFKNPTDRRHFIKSAGAASIGMIASGAGSAQAADGATVIETKIISQQPEYYNGWSTLARRKNGELWLTWSGGRVAHVCPFGQACC